MRSRRTVFASVYDVLHGTEEKISIDIVDNNGYLAVEWRLMRRIWSVQDGLIDPSCVGYKLHAGYEAGRGAE